MNETLLSGNAAAQVAADIERTKAEHALAKQQREAHHRDVIAPLLQRQEELKILCKQERDALEREYQRRDAEIFERYRVELERLNAQLQAAAY